MRVKTFVDRKAMSTEAARQAAKVLGDLLTAQGRARIIAATGASQIEFLESLVTTPGIDWTRVEMFHLDEYVGLPIAHPASFRRYLLERLIQSTGLVSYHLLDGERDAVTVADDAGRAIASAPIDRRVCRHRREWTPRLQRSACRLHHRAALPRRHAGRRVPAAAGRRGLVRVDRGRAGASDLDVDSPDSEGTHHPVRRAGRA